MKLTYLPLIATLAISLSIACESDTTTEEVGTSNPVSNKNPNILLIIADDMGLDATPGFNVGTIKPNTPNLQNMINTGVRFTNLWSYPTCTPTRSSILTGKYGFRTGVMKVDDELSTTETSLQQFLKDNTGYNSAVIGKWHLSTDPTHPTQMGVEYYAGLLSGGVRSYWEWNLTQNQSISSSNEYTTTKFTDLAINWVQQQNNQPWFFMVGF